MENNNSVFFFIAVFSFFFVNIPQLILCLQSVVSLFAIVNSTCLYMSFDVC